MLQQPEGREGGKEGGREGERIRENMGDRRDFREVGQASDSQGSGPVPSISPTDFFILESRGPVMRALAYLLWFLL